MLQVYVLGMCKLRCSYSLKQLTEKVVLDFSPSCFSHYSEGGKKRGMKSVSEITSCWLVIRAPILLLAAPGQCPGQVMVAVKSFTL